jgi:DNA replication protein DnaC
MDDAKLLSQVNDMILSQQKVEMESSGSNRPYKAASAILARLNIEPVSPEVLEARTQQEAARALQQRAAEIDSRSRSLAMRVGKRYAKASLDGYEVTHDAQRAVEGYIRDYISEIEQRVSSGSGLFLIGPPGTGKDHLMVAVLFAAVDKGLNAVWVDGMELFTSARDNIDTAKTEASWLATYTKPDLLAISDPVPPLGSVKEGFQLATLFSIIDRRYRDMKPTLMTLNVNDRDEAEKRMAPNIVDRLAHGALVLRCDWPSYRRN